MNRAAEPRKTAIDIWITVSPFRPPALLIGRVPFHGNRSSRLFYASRRNASVLRPFSPGMRLSLRATFLPRTIRSSRRVLAHCFPTPLAALSCSAVALFSSLCFSFFSFFSFFFFFWEMDAMFQNTRIGKVMENSLGEITALLAVSFLLISPSHFSLVASRRTTFIFYLLENGPIVSSIFAWYCSRLDIVCYLKFLLVDLNDLSTLGCT